MASESFLDTDFGTIGKRNDDDHDHTATVAVGDPDADPDANPYGDSYGKPDPDDPDFDPDYDADAVHDLPNPYPDFSHANGNATDSVTVQPEPSGDGPAGVPSVASVRPDSGGAPSSSASHDRWSGPTLVFRYRDTKLDIITHTSVPRSLDEAIEYFALIWKWFATVEDTYYYIEQEVEPDEWKLLPYKYDGRTGEVTWP